MNALRRHWPEYLMEAAGLGIFMISASVVTVILEHPVSPIRQVLRNASLCHWVFDDAIIYSPWGQSGAHINPVVTFTFWRLER